MSVRTLLWETTWRNYTLYLAAINSDDDEAESADKPKMEVRDVNDIF